MSVVSVSPPGIPVPPVCMHMLTYTTACVASSLQICFHSRKGSVEHTHMHADQCVRTYARISVHKLIHAHALTTAALVYTSHSIT